MFSRQYPLSSINAITFRVYTSGEIEKISVLHVTNEESINALGHYLQDGLYDLRMGPMSIIDDEDCKTCFNKASKCGGHCGHINLPLLIFNPFFTDIIQKLTSRVCYNCHRFQVTAKQALQFIYETKLVLEGHSLEALEVSDWIRSFSQDEAIEVFQNIEERYEKSNKHDLQESAANALQLRENLEKCYNRVIAGTPADMSPTCNSQAVYQLLIKRFFQNTKSSFKACHFCRVPFISVAFQNMQLTIKNKSKICEVDESSVVKSKQPYLTPEQVRTILRGCWSKDGALIKYLYPMFNRTDLPYPTDLLFLEKLLVIPPKFRPCTKLKESVFENDMTLLYKNVLKLTKCLRFLVLYKNDDLQTIPDNVQYLVSQFEGETITQKSHAVWLELQRNVTALLDSERTFKITSSSKGIRQLIEKKFGLFRRNLMGKRVNFSARSVAAPDPILAVDEVGVPKDFAMKLTYPSPVFAHNVNILRELVINGPNKYPGAILIEDEEGKKVNLKASDEKQRIALAKSLLTGTESCVQKVNPTKIVYRHLQNGDYVLMNRQPTLHKPSIQAHKARVMPKDKVLRMPYANCKAYNADFDGDELNLHFPQNEFARSEASQLISTQNQYLTPRDGSPLAGLIQDSVVASVMLTLRGNFFIRADYQQLVYVAVSECKDKIRLLPPAIMKPQQLWAGKQIVSTILLNIIPKNRAKLTMKSKAAVKAEMFEESDPREWLGGGDPEKQKDSMTEAELILRDGELLSGVIDKNAIGSKSYGLVHACYDLYGGAVASSILTSMNRLCVWYLQWVGHTIGLKEFVTPVEVSEKRRFDLNQLLETADKEVSKKLGVPREALPSYIERQHHSSNEKEMAAIDSAYTSVLGQTSSEIVRDNEKQLYRNNLRNHMRLMIDTGAKGSRVNMNQMASLFGSVALDGKRMPMSITGKTLPSFRPYDVSPLAGGYIPTRFVTGMDPNSYFFLCIVGRDSLQHTAVKTSFSGYMQRCLIKHLEGIYVKYDGTVRNSDNVVIQFNYGEDSLDVTKVPFLMDTSNFDTVVDNCSRLMKKEDLARLEPEDSKYIKKYKNQIKKLKKDERPRERRSGFLEFCKEKERKFSCDHKTYKDNLVRIWQQFSQEEKNRFEARVKKCPDPLMAKFPNSHQLSVVSEVLDDMINSYFEEKYSKRPVSEQTLSKKEVTRVIHQKALASRVDPGEPVGALCAQAIGEPLTQMTLNTFHFAGRDELNITLGVPRMIEILRSASENILTPIMEVPFHPGVSLAMAESLRKLLMPVHLSKVTLQVTVTGSLERRVNLLRCTTIRFQFLPYKEYKKVFPLTPEKILSFMENSFFKKVLIKEIIAALQKVDSFGANYKVEKKEKGEKEDDETPLEVNQLEAPKEDELTSEEEDNAEQAEDLDVATSMRQGKKQEMDYSEDEEDEEEEEVDSDVGLEPSVKTECKHSEDEGFIDAKSEEDEDEFRSTSKRKVPTKRGIKEQVNSTGKAKRVNKLLAQDGWIMDYDYDELSSEWCEITLGLPIAEGKYDLASILRNTVENSLVHFVPNIKKAFLVENDGLFILRTEGVNINKMYAYEHYLDINRLYTNNIHVMSRQFGIEAAQRTIIREIRAVQIAYDIKVDFRHLSLLADYFTCEGIYKACSRHALASCASTIQKMSYETFFQFLKHAVIQGHTDIMRSPSANIMVGQPVKLGTCSEFATLLSYS